MKIALIGADGQLGTDLSRVISANKNLELIPLIQKDLDVRYQSVIVNVLTKINPDVVINTAAYHKVDEVEDNPEEAFLVNGIAVKNLAEWCASKDKTLVFISTDYVFGRERGRKLPYEEIDRTNPVNVYGISKVAGEYFATMCPKHYVVRTSGLFGTAGAMGKGGNFIETMLRLAKDGKVRVVSDQVLSPTYTFNLAQQIVKLLDAPYGLYHAVSEGKCSWHEFATEIFRQTNTEVECTSVLSGEFPTRAERPKYSVLDNKKLRDLKINIMRHWKESLKEYLIEKGHLHGTN